MVTRWAMWCTWLGLFPCLLSHAREPSPAHALLREQQWVELASAGLDPRALQTLSRLIGVPRQLLALRAYLRAGDSLASKWSWTPQQRAAYADSVEGRAAATDVEAVEQAFARANPGFSAHANSIPRSLESQVDHWNENPGVSDVGRELQGALEQRFPANAPPPDVDFIRQALMEWRPTVAAPLAAPGLSAHGQGRAFDFQIEHDGKVAAGTDVSTARRQWDQRGWTLKLRAAVLASGKPFTGPLQSPYEPWHYSYSATSR